MSKKTRRKNLAKRTKSGRIVAQMLGETAGPMKAARLRDLALSGAADPKWGTVIGQLFARNQISASQFDAAEKYLWLYRQWAKAKDSPYPIPSKMTLEARTGRSVKFLEEDTRQETIDSYEAARDSIKRMAEDVFNAVVLNQYPDWPGKPRLWQGLDLLSKHFAEYRPHRRRTKKVTPSAAMVTLMPSTSTVAACQSNDTPAVSAAHAIL